MKNKIRYFSNGMTVKELKEMVKHWPEKDLNDKAMRMGLAI